MQLRPEGGRSVTAELVSLRALGADFFLDFLAMIVIVRQARVNIGKGDGRNLGDNFVRGQSLPFVPDRDVQHADPVSHNTGAPSADTGGLRDALWGRRHDYRIALP
jgi:hypothetical protein